MSDPTYPTHVRYTPTIYRGHVYCPVPYYTPHPQTAEEARVELDAAIATFRADVRRWAATYPDAARWVRPLIGWLYE